MFFPKAMTEVQLIVPSKDLVTVTQVLGSRGVFHQIDSTYLGAESSGQNSWQEKAASYSSFERRIQAMLQSLNLVEEVAPSSGFDAMADLDAIRAAVERLEAEVKRTVDELSAEKKKMEQLETELHVLEPIAHVDVEVGVLRESRHLYSVLGVVPADNVSRLETSLARIPHVLFTLREDPQKPVLWILGPRSNSDVIERATKSAYLNPLTLPTEFAGSPAAATASMLSAVDQSKRRMAELDKELARLASVHQVQLRKLLWDVHASRVTADAIARFGQLRHAYVIVGWVPSADLESLRTRLKQASAETLIEARPIERAGHHANVPVALSNPTALGPFEMLVNTYARPRYEEIDPTLLIAVTYPVLFGAMFGDVGHGLVMALIGAVMSVRARRFGGLWGLITFCGLAGMVFGFLYGSLFGFEDVLPANPFFKQFFWMHPIENIIETLGITVALGVVLLSIGLFLNLYNAARAKDWGRFFFDSNGLAGLIFYWSFLTFVGSIAGLVFVHLPVPTLVIVISGVLVVAGALVAVVFSEPLKHLVEGHRPLVEGGWGMHLVQSMFELLEKFISMFSNSMSYVRVGAFAIAHAGFSLAVFVFAGLASGGTNAGIGYIVVLIIGNLFIIGFEGFIVSIQTMRLHYYEFFSKFFLGGGSRYEPLHLPSAREN